MRTSYTCRRCGASFAWEDVLESDLMQEALRRCDQAGEESLTGDEQACYHGTLCPDCVESGEIGEERGALLLASPIPGG